MTYAVRKQLSRIVVFILPLILIIGLIPLWISHHRLYMRLFREDHFFENLQVLLYLLSFLAALFIGIRFFRARNNLFGLLYLVLAFASFVIAMEEISWGQRIFGIPTPTFFKEHNYQKELTIHNLGGTWDYLHLVYTLVGFMGAFAWLILPKLKAMYGLTVSFLVPNWYLAPYFLPVFLIYLYYSISAYLDGFFLPLNFDDQEPAELLMSLGVLLFLIINVHRQSLQRL
jgi:hypothetical protein